MASDKRAVPMPLGHEFKQWAEKPDYIWCMAQVPDGPGYLRICRQIKEAHIATPAEPTPEPWRLRLICCGRDDGELFFPTGDAADAAREAYMSGVGVATFGYSSTSAESGHRRAAIKELVAPAQPHPAPDLCAHRDLHFLGKNRGVYCRFCGSTWRRSKTPKGHSHLMLTAERQTDGVL